MHTHYCGYRMIVLNWSDCIRIDTIMQELYPYFEQFGRYIG